MPLICLLGRHGSGKSTLGQSLAELGYKHFSVGMLRRLAVAGQFPSDVPAVLMLALRRSPAGAPLSPDVAKKLLRFASQFPDVVLDGFPSSQAHLEFVPTSAQFALVWCPRLLRDSRLTERSTSTQRLWTPGRNSDRETALPALVRQIRMNRYLHFFPNRDGALDPSRLLSEISRTIGLA